MPRFVTFLALFSILLVFSAIKHPHGQLTGDRLSMCKIQMVQSDMTDVKLKLKQCLSEKIAQRTTSYQWLGTTPKPACGRFPYQCYPVNSCISYKGEQHPEFQCDGGKVCCKLLK